MKNISIHHNRMYLEFRVTDENQLKLLHLGAKPLDPSNLKAARPFASDWGGMDLIKEGFPLVQLQIPGSNRPYEKQGNKALVTSPGYRLTFVSFEDTGNESGRLLTFVQEDKELSLLVTSYLQFYGELPVFRIRHRIKNCGSDIQPLTYVSSFFYMGIEKEGEGLPDEKLLLSIAHNSWMKEMNWKSYDLYDMGLQFSQKGQAFPRTSKSFVIANTGHWSTKEFLPMGYLENKKNDTAIFWQIEHNGSWVMELSDYNGHFCLGLSGPDELHSHWCKMLKPGETFETVPAAVGAVSNDFNLAMGALTDYRRKIRRKNQDNEKLPVIFNDYMNCLFGDPTTEKELPLIDAAAACGMEYYVIDAGWYDDGFWWDSVGAWEESRKRFPKGLREVTDYIRKKGMIPGVWLELEVMGIKSPLADSAPDDWFFMRHGRKIYDRSRFQLDFRNPAVRAHIDDILDRIIREYGVGYIKLDYNIEPGIGTDHNADSAGDGLLEHERAYLSWLDGVFARYPELVIENCSSGGLRMDYAMLSRYSIQSTSDNEDYLMYATIAANAPAAVTPEQAAVWSYPKRDADREEVIFNMVNAMLLRVHQSGHLAELGIDRLALVKEGIDCYKKIRNDLREAVPFWPLGLSDYRDAFSCLVLKKDKRAYLAVWRRGGEEETVSLPLDCLKEEISQAACIYPSLGCEFSLDENRLLVRLPGKNMARLFALTLV